MLLDEEYYLKCCLHGKDIFVSRRAHLLLASSRGVSVPELSRQTLFPVSTIRALIHLFNQGGTPVLKRQTNRPKNCAPLLSAHACEQIHHFLHHSPREWGKNTSLWSLQLLAQVLYEEGLTPHQVSYETVRRALLREGLSWKRAKHWITSPDPGYARKKNAESA